MVAGRGEGIRHAFEQIFAVMLNGRGLPMHHAIIDDHVATEDVANALVTKADSQRRDVRAETAYDLIGKTGFSWRARAGRYKNAVGVQFANALESNLVIAVDLHLHLHLAEVLHEVVGKRIVVVDDQ